MIVFGLLGIALVVWLAYEIRTAPWEPLEWSLPKVPGVVDLRGDAQDGEE